MFRFDEANQPELLLVDDNELMVVAMRRWLKREMGWDTYGFTDANEALAFLRNKPEIDIIIADLHMPLMTGVDFLEAAQLIHEDAIQILMTGFDYHDAVVGAINRLNLYFFLEKPWDSQKLALVLHNAWEKKRLSSTIQRQIHEVTETVSKLNATQHDLTRHKNQAAIGRLIQGICHNLNSPLGVILGQCQMLNMRLQEAPEQTLSTAGLRSSIDDIQAASERIRHIVRNLMLKSRMEQTPERLRIPIEKLINQELEFLQADPFLKHRVERRLSLESDTPEVSINYADFSQIFSNLVHNALDAMSEVSAPCLEIKTLLADGHVILEVHDNGPGVPVDLRERIFQPFFTTKVPVEQIPASELLQDAQKPKGTGLGLHSVVDILAPYGGTIHVVDSHLGGACFRVSFPMIDTSSPSQDPSMRAI